MQYNLCIRYNISSQAYMLYWDGNPYRKELFETKEAAQIRLNEDLAFYNK